MSLALPMRTAAIDGAVAVIAVGALERCAGLVPVPAGCLVPCARRG
jgi:hypothetical protein